MDGLPSSASVAKSFTGAKLVKGFNHLGAATLATDPIVEGGHRVVFVERRRGLDRSRADLAKQLGSHPSSWEGSTRVARWCTRGSTWGQLIFRDLFKKEEESTVDRAIWPE